MKICIGLLSNRGFKGKTVISLLKMIDESREYDFHFAFIDSGYTIAENRNYLSWQAVKNNCDYLLMIDDDMIFPPEALGVLVSRDKDIIALPFNVRAPAKEGEEISRRKNVTYFPTDELTPPLPTDEPYEVMAIGAAFILIKTDVFNKLPQPYFDFDRYEHGMTKVGEDSWFCYKAADHGYKIWCEPTLQELGHIGEYIY